MPAPDGSAPLFDYGLSDARETVAAGARIVPVMTPDATLGEDYANPLPAYEECYPLRAVCVRGPHFWGQTGGTNLPHRFGHGISHPVVFAYTNSAPLYASFAQRALPDVLREPTFELSLATLRQYKAFRFITRPGGDPVWDGAAPAHVDALRDAIAQGHDFRLVFEDSAGLLFSLPVDLPMYFPGTGALTVTTHPAFMPGFVGDPQSLIDAIERVDANALHNPSPTAIRTRIKTRALPVFFSLHSDGNYFTAKGIAARAAERWRMARLYAY